MQFEYNESGHALAAGDALYFDANVPGGLIDPGKKPATVSCVFRG